MAEETGRILAKEMVSAVCINWAKKEILTVQNNTDPKKPLGFVGCPGGKMKASETPEMAGIRELKQETNQDGKITKYVIEIPKIGPYGPYIHYFILAIIIPDGKELKNHEDPRDVPKWVPLQEIIARRIKMFRGHIQGLILLLKKMTEEKKIENNKLDRNGIRIISEGSSALFETLEELKNHFLENGYHTIPRYLYRD